MRSHISAAATAAALALTLTACGGGYDADLVDALKAQGATQEEAECFIDEIGEDDAQAFLDVMGDETPPDNVDEIVAALDECGVEADGAGAGDATASDPPEDVEEAPEETGSVVAGGAIDDAAACLEAAGFTVTRDDGPPVRLDVIGEDGNAAIFQYDDSAAAGDAADQFIDAFGGDDFTAGSSGDYAYYVRSSSEEASAVEGCVP